MPLHPNLNWFKFAAKFFFFSRIFLDKPPSVHYLPEIARLESFLCELTIMIQIKPGLEVSGGYEGIAPPKWSLFLIFYFLFFIRRVRGTKASRHLNGPYFSSHYKQGSGKNGGGKICPDSAIFHPNYRLINAVKKLISAFLLPLIVQTEAPESKVKI